MAIVRVERVLYQTSDGQEFADEKEAQNHEDTLDLASFLDCTDIYWRRGVDPAEVAKEILANYVVVRRKDKSNA